MATADLKRGYATVLTRWCPPVQVVADPFHVIHDANARLAAVRRLEPSEARQAIPRWPLVQGAERLTARQRTQLAAIQAPYPAWGALYRLTEDRRSLFESPTAAAAAQALSRWLLNAEACAHAAGRVGAGFLRRWRREILAHGAQPQGGTNGFLEGFHTKIKHLKRVRDGFRHRDRYRRKMLLGFLPPSRILHFLT